MYAQVYNAPFNFEDNLTPLERKKVVQGRFSDLSGAAKTQGKAGVNAFGQAVNVGFQVSTTRRRTAGASVHAHSAAPADRELGGGGSAAEYMCVCCVMAQDPDKMVPGDLGFDPVSPSSQHNLQSARGRLPLTRLVHAHACVVSSWASLTTA